MLLPVILPALPPVWYIEFTQELFASQEKSPELCLWLMTKGLGIQNKMHTLDVSCLV